MALEKQIVSVPLVGGLSQKVDANVLDPPGMRAVLNKQFTKGGAFDTRGGWTTATTSALPSTTLDKPRAILSTTRDLVAVSDQQVAYAWGETLGKWSARGLLPTWVVTTTPLVRSLASSEENAKCAYGGGYLWISFTRNGYLWLQPYDTATMTPVSDELRVNPPATTVGPWAVGFVGGKCVVFYANTTSGSYAYATVSPSTPSSISRTTLSAYSASTPACDMYIGGPGVVFAYSRTNTKIVVEWYSASLASVGTTGDITYSKAKQISVASSSSMLFIAARSYDTIGAAPPQFLVSMWCWDFGTATLSNEATIYDWSVPGDICSGVALEMYDSTHAVLLATRSSWAGGTAGTTRTWGTYCAKIEYVIAHGYPAITGRVDELTPQTLTSSRPFTENSRWYAWMSVNGAAMRHTATLASMQHTGFGLFDITSQIGSALAIPASAPVVAWAAPRRVVSDGVYSVTGVNEGTGDLVATDGSTMRWCACQVYGATVTHEPGAWGRHKPDVNRGADLVTLDLRQWRSTSANVSKLACVNGGLTSVYTQNSNVFDATTFLGGPNEWGFLSAPEGISASVAAGAGVPDGNYEYAAIYEWTDDSGHIVRSPTAVTPSVTAGGGNNAMTVKIPYLKLTNKQGALAVDRPASIILFRREGTAGIFYRVTPNPTGSTWVNNADTTTLYMSYSDSGVLGAYDGNEQLYTTGGVVDAVCPPPFSTVASHKSRVFGAANDVLWWSTNYTFDAQPWFNDTQILTIADGGDITGLASLDSYLIIFKKTGIFAMTGEGPSDTGSGNDFTVQKVTTPLGCINPRSIATTSEGVVFQAAEGLFMIDRSMQIQYIGAGVEDTLALYPEVTSTTYIPGSYQVRFAVCEPGTETGLVLIYDLTFKLWAEWQNGDGVSSVIAMSGQTPAVLGPVYTTSTASVKFEQGASTDDGEGIVSGFVTAWIKLGGANGSQGVGGMQGFQRVRRVMLLGKSVSETGLIVAVLSDYEPTPSTIYTLSAADVLNATRDGVVQLEFHVARQKCQAIQVEVIEVADTSHRAPTSTFTASSPGSYSPGDQVCFIAATASGSSYAWRTGTPSQVYWVTVVSVSGSIVRVDEDVSTWTAPPGADWYVVTAAWLSTHANGVTHKTTASAAAANQGTAYTAATPGRGITWESMALEVGVLPMRYKGLAPAARH